MTIGPIEERTQALTAWCTGFLYGLGTSGAADPQRLPGELGEIVRDLTEITRAGVDAPTAKRPMNRRWRS